MAFIPCRREIFCADGRFVKWLHLGIVVVVICKGNGRVETVDGLSVRDAELREASRTIGSELAKVHIEGTVFLEHEEDVLDHAGIARADGYGCHLRDVAA